MTCPCLNLFSTGSVVRKSKYLDLLLCESVKLLLVMPHKIRHTIMASGASLCWHDCAIQCVHHTAIIRGKTGLLRQNEQIYGLKVRCLEEMWMNHEGSCKLQWINDKDSRKVNNLCQAKNNNKNTRNCAIVPRAWTGPSRRLDGTATNQHPSGPFFSRNRPF